MNLFLILYNLNCYRKCFCLTFYQCKNLDLLNAFISDIKDSEKKSQYF